VRLLVRRLLPLAVAVLTVGACGSAEPAVPQAERVASARLVGPAAFAEAMRDPQRVVINVHTPDEGSIRNTDLAIPFDQLRDRADELPADRDSRLAVYCMSGNMSAIAVDTLAEMGYRDLTELDGGMEALRRSGRTLVGTDNG